MAPSNANTSGLLAPCPFCGGAPFDRGFRRWECGSCGAQGPAGPKADATSGWNRRVIAASAQARIAAAEARADRLAKAVDAAIQCLCTRIPGGVLHGDETMSVLRAALQQETKL